MEIVLKKNEVAYITFPMVNTTSPDGFDTGETVTDTAYYKDGTGAWTSLAITDTVTEISTTGVYSIDLTSTEMNHDLIAIKFTSTNAADTMVMIRTYASDVDDLVRSTTPANTLDVSATGEAGIDWANVGTPGTTVDLSATSINLTDITTGVTNEVTADVTAISGTAVAADNLELLFDGNEGFYIAYQGPHGPGVYLDDSAANTNTVNGVDGTIGNPVSTIAAAKAIADSMSLDRFYLIQGSAITLTSAMSNYEFAGLGDMSTNSVTLNSQNVTDSGFINLLITGAQGGTGQMELRECAISSLTGADILARRCSVENNITFARDSYMHQCFSAVAGSGTPQYNCNSIVSLALSIRDYSGGAEFTNAVSTTNISLEGNGQYVINANCTSINLSVRGNFKETDNGTTSSITRDDNSTALENGFDANNRVDVGSIDGSITSANNLKESTTAIVATSVNDTGASTTAFVITSTEATDDHFNGRTIVFTSGILINQATQITDYTGSTKTVTVQQLTEAPSNNDTFVIV